MDDEKELELDKPVDVEEDLSGTPIILSCIRNEPQRTADESKPWPLKTLFDQNIKNHEEDILYLKDDYNCELLINAHMTDRYKSRERLAAIY